MTTIFWDESYATGIQMVDQQHQRLFVLINDLYEAMRQGKGRDVMEQTLVGMADYARTHFEMEEKLMERHAYPNLAAHRAEHAVFNRKVAELRAQAQNGTIGLAVDVMTFLKEWLVHHIRQSDHAYAPFLKGKGVK